MKHWTLHAACAVVMLALFACSHESGIQEPDSPSMESIRFETPVLFGDVPIREIGSRGDVLVFTTSEGSAIEVSANESGFEVASPTFRMRWYTQDEITSVHKAALENGNVTAYLDGTRGVAASGETFEHYVFNGDQRTFTIAPRSSARAEFYEWYNQSIVPSQLMAENNPAAAHLASFVRSKELSYVLATLLSVGADDAHTREEAGRWIERLDGLSEDEIEFICNMASTCSMLVCMFSPASPVCALCQGVSILCISRYWIQKIPELSDQFELLLIELRRKFEEWLNHSAPVATTTLHPGEAP